MNHVFPSPAVVVGLGRFGLATLELLGDDWATLQLSGADASLKNLRLVWAEPAAGSREADWRLPERKTVEIARHAGDGDLPTLALELAVLRSLGLIRFRDGTYQIAVPRDAGLAKAEGEADAAGEAPARRRRYFEWWALSPDPIAAAERLRRLAERSSELDLFITPILNRVRQGHSPQVLLATIARCWALAEGRDPGPWPWYREQVREAAAAGLGHEEAGLEVPVFADEVWPGEAERREEELLEGFAPEPLAGWAEWRREPARPLALFVPRPFLPTEPDFATPLDLASLLKVDWEDSGWASDETSGPEGVSFKPVAASAPRLGLFDHDGSPTARRGPAAGLAERLRELAELLHRGLLRLWIDLQRDRVEGLYPEISDEPHATRLDDALRQSLEILGELLVRPLASRAESGEEAAPPEAEARLPGEPSPFLAALTVERRETGRPAERALAARLAELGMAGPAARQEETVPLLRRVAVAPGDVSGAERGLHELRRVLNELTRQLFSAGFLSEYRDRPTRRPPRLTVYVVADVGEPFARAALRPVLREIHAELLRAFSPIFEIYREGFDRCLSIVPLLWMPHPSDPFEGRASAHARGEEAAVVDAVHGVRRWVESVLPARWRRIPQIFVNGRVTDNATLTLADAVRQTRDFLSLQVRNDLGADDWLKRTAVGSGGDDLFASFSCYEIDFPAELCREYLANRLARASLGFLKTGPAAPPPEPEPAAFEPPPVEDLVRELRQELLDVAGEAAGRIAARVEDRLEIGLDVSTGAVLAAFDEEMEASLLQHVQQTWSELSRSLGRMDEMIDTLRRRTSSLLAVTVQEVVRTSDGLIETLAARGGLQAAQAGFHHLRGLTRRLFRDREELRRAAEALCIRHRIPDTAAVGAARERVREAARRKPDRAPMRMGLVAWALMAPVLGAPLAHAVATGLDLHRKPGLLETLLGPLGWLTGGLAVLLPAVWLLGWHLRLQVEELRRAVSEMAEAVRRLVRGAGEPAEKEASPSLRSFFESRLLLTGALATRGFSLRVFERALADASLAHRLGRSLDVQSALLARQAEALGVQTRMAETGEGEDDLGRLFAARTGEGTGRLIHPDRLLELFRRRYGREDDLAGTLPALLRAGGGLRDWRRSAPLADGERLMGFCRGRFEAVATTPITEQDAFAEDVERRLRELVHRRYSVLGFGAKFVGYEGLDPDGVQVLADAALVLNPALEGVFRRARPASSLPVITARIRPNSAYMLSLVQGIRAHSVRNLKRFESFHDRVHMPDDRTFPLSQEDPTQFAQPPINLISPYLELGDRLRDRLRPAPPEE